MIKTIIKIGIVWVLVFNSWKCNTISKRDNFVIRVNHPDLLIYSNDVAIGKKESIVLSEKDWKLFFASWQKEKSPKSVVQNLEIFREEQVDLISRELGELIQKDKGRFSYLVVSKRNDPIAPYTRIYKTSFQIDFSENKLFLSLYDLDSNQIFVQSYQTMDWAYPSESVLNCGSKERLFFSKEFPYKHFSIWDANCKEKNQEGKNFSKLEIVWNELDSKPLTQSQKSTKERLLELETLWKEKMISKEEYDWKRKEILKDL
jgi:hypothetical protein